MQFTFVPLLDFSYNIFIESNSLTDGRLCTFTIFSFHFPYYLFSLMTIHIIAVCVVFIYCFDQIK